MSASCNVYWNWPRLMRPPTVMSCEDWRVSLTPSTRASCGGADRLMPLASVVRWSRGFSPMKKRPVLAVARFPCCPWRFPPRQCRGLDQPSPSDASAAPSSCGEMPSRLGEPRDQPGVLDGEETLGDDDIEINAQSHGAKHTVSVTKGWGSTPIKRAAIEPRVPSTPPRWHAR